MSCSFSATAKLLMFYFIYVLPSERFQLIGNIHTFRKFRATTMQEITSARLQILQKVKEYALNQSRNHGCKVVGDEWSAEKHVTSRWCLILVFLFFFKFQVAWIGPSWVTFLTGHLCRMSRLWQHVRCLDLQWTGMGSTKHCEWRLQMFIHISADSVPFGSILIHRCK